MCLNFDSLAAKACREGNSQQSNGEQGAAIGAVWLHCQCINIKP